MQKTLVIQVEVGGVGGYVYRSDQSPKSKEASKLFEKLTPTVERYCQKHDYDYKKIIEYPKDIDILFFNKSTKGKEYDYSVGGKNKCSTLIRYLNMYDDNYDRIVTLDNDIWIPEWAEPLPEVEGHHGVQDLGKPFNEFKQYYKVPFGKFINGGVQMVSKQAGKSLKEFVTNKCNKKQMPIIHTDQAYMNEWRSKNLSLSYVLDKKWNYMVDCFPKINNYERYNFIHYAGWNGRSFLIEDFKAGIIK